MIEIVIRNDKKKNKLVVSLKKETREDEITLFSIFKETKEIRGLIYGVTVSFLIVPALRTIFKNKISMLRVALDNTITIKDKHCLRKILKYLQVSEDECKIYQDNIFTTIDCI